MNCPECGKHMYVVDTAYLEKTEEMYRKLRCRNCGREMFTIEFELDNVEEAKQIFSEFNKVQQWKRKD